MHSIDKPKLYVISGAGLSAESGIPTFRDAGGLWSQYSVDRVCNALTWKRHREEVFEFYSKIREAYSAAQPNAAHRQLAAWQKKWGPERVVLLTQNVDGLLEAAGAAHVVHLHGKLTELHCTACGTRWESEIHVEARCPKCTSLKGVKPGIVMFMEAAPEYARLHKMHKHLRATDVVVFVGSAFEVISPAVAVPARLAGAERIVNVNPVRSSDTAIGTHIEARASEGLAGLDPQLSAWMEA